jgi:hypothetical protein
MEQEKIQTYVELARECFVCFFSVSACTGFEVNHIQCVKS